MDNYYNQWRKQFLNWKKIIRTQYMAIMNTFDPRTIDRFIQNVINKDGDEECGQELSFLAETLKVSGSKPYSQLDIITQALIQSYKQINRIFSDEAKKMNEKNKFIESFLLSKKLDKIKFGNTEQNGITQYIIDDENDDYPEINSLKQPSKKQEHDSGENTNATNDSLSSSLEHDFHSKVFSELPTNLRTEIEVNIRNHNQIFLTLPSNRLQSVTSVTIKYLTPQNVPQTLKNLSFCEKLEQLNIQEPLFATKEIIIFIVASFPKLKRLYLNCYNQFDDECAFAVMKDRPHIQRLYWGCNFSKCVAKMAELRIWREHLKKKKKVSLKCQTLLFMVRNLKSLQNLWISEFDSKQAQTLFSELKKMPKLRHLSLGQYNVPAEDISIPQHIWPHLYDIPNLQSIAFIRTNLNDIQFCSLLSKHKSSLRTLVIYKSPGLTDYSFKMIKENEFKALKEIYLVQIGSRQLQGQYLWDLIQLETLVVRGCEFSHVFAEEKVGKMKNLINLDLNGCEWVSDLFMSCVSKFSKTLEYLNLRHSKITFHTREHINRLPKLRALDIGYTNINQFDIEKICEANTNIQKISLCGLSGSTVLIARGVLSKGKMHVIGKLLKNCTHLDVSACDRLDDTSLDRFIKLQFVNVWNCKGISEYTKQMLREHGVVVFDRL